VKRKEEEEGSTKSFKEKTIRTHNVTSIEQHNVTRSDVEDGDLSLFSSSHYFSDTIVLLSIQFGKLFLFLVVIGTCHLFISLLVSNQPSHSSHPTRFRMLSRLDSSTYSYNNNHSKQNSHTIKPPLFGVLTCSWDRSKNN
jgi:hypothetical protein